MCAFCSYELDLILCPACLSPNEVHLKEGQLIPPNQTTYPIDSRYDVIESSAPLVSQRCLTQKPSSKLAELVSNLRQHLQTDKSIVFSCWKATLDILEPMLLQHGIKYFRIDGNVSNIERTTTVQQFQENPEVNVLLMTTGTGAVGLNLTAATRVHLVEPQWNPAVEAQAIGRAVRLGQSRPVTIIRYIMQDTIEKRTQSRQVVKLRLAKMTLDEEGRDYDKAWGRFQELRLLVQ